MSSAVSLRLWLRHGGWLAVATAAVVAALVAARGGRVLRGVAVPEKGAAAASPWPEPAAWDNVDWGVWRAQDAASAAPVGDLGKRYRLAGTFFEFTAVGSGNRRAVLDDFQKGDQILVNEHDRLDTVEVAQIMRDRLILRENSGRETVLWLTFSGSATDAGGQPAAAAEASAVASAAARFGGMRTGERRWTFQRDTLMSYYQELRDQPERLVLLFDSLKPVYDARGRIGGYRLGTEGEKDFFDAVGLEEGDTVLQVNNVAMSNRRRAEFFIRQFVENQASAFVLDVNRGGVTNRLTYEVR